MITNIWYGEMAGASEEQTLPAVQASPWQKWKETGMISKLRMSGVAIILLIHIMSLAKVMASYLLIACCICGWECFRLNPINLTNASLHFPGTWVLPGRLPTGCSQGKKES